jgi:hypothetical protein
MMTTTTVATRRPAVAGMFYPAGKAELRAEVEAYLAEARPAGPQAAAKIVVVPHAGYVYSAPVAAQAYARLAAQRGRVRRVVLAGPTHRVGIRGIAVPGVDAFDTPLGRMRLDRAAIASLAGLPQVLTHDAAHAAEHALEVQLPFLQAVLGDVAIVPLAVGHVAPQQVAEVFERLWGGDETLIVVSTDLSHYLPYEQARAADARTVQAILALDPTLDHAQACGATPLAGALIAARAHALRPRLLDLRNSGDTAGDRARVVGYCAIAFEAGDGEHLDEDAAGARGAADDEAGSLGAALTSRARNAIGAAFGLAALGEPAHASLGEPGATFVTLSQGGALRGCIGSLEPHRLLEQDVRHNAHAAAFGDPRFAPLARHELQGLRIEVSLIGSASPVPAADEAAALRQLRPGVDGLILQWRGRRATFLPQVWQQLPRAADFVAALKRKAGLSEAFWHAELQLARYAVRKFGREFA